MKATPTGNPARRTMALLALAAVVVAGCGGSGPASRDSGVEGVPIPAEAEEFGRERGARYYEAPRMSYGDIVAFYDRAMPVSRGFRDWSLCATGEEVLESPNERYTYRAYERGPDEALWVMVIDSDTSSVGTFIEISTGPTARAGVGQFC